MTETGIIEKENYQTEEINNQKVIFDSTIYNQIRKQEITLKIDNVLDVPIVKNWFQRPKEEYYIISQKEHTVDCKYAKGKAMVPIICKKELNKEIQALKPKPI